jgi:hypothetical protein
MKKLFFVFTITLLFGCGASVYKEPIVDADFLNDLGSENYRINGELYLDVYDMDLTGLNYDAYIKYLTDNLKPSAEGLINKINLADDNYFTSNDSSFVIVLWYPRDMKVVVDDAYTSDPDTVVNILDVNELRKLDIYISYIE